MLKSCPAQEYFANVSFLPQPLENINTGVCSFVIADCVPSAGFVCVLVVFVCMRDNLHPSRLRSIKIYVLFDTMRDLPTQRGVNYFAILGDIPP